MQCHHGALVCLVTICVVLLSWHALQLRNVPVKAVPGLSRSSPSLLKSVHISESHATTLQRVRRSLQFLYRERLPWRVLDPIRRPLRRDPQDPFNSASELGDAELVPRNALGFPCEDNPRVEDMGIGCQFIARNHFGMGCQKRIVDLARDRGKDVDRIPPIFRSARVADACPETCGLCKICAPGCALWFVGNSYCEPECNNEACNFDATDCWDTDCLVGEWSEWGPCSISCDPGGANGIGGVETRTREVLHQKTLNGKPCPSLVEDRTGCNKGVLCPVSCQVSEWGDWSLCSAECGPGESIRERAVLQPPENGAPKCPELLQKRPCFISECQQECETSEWSPMSECSNQCGPGTRSRRRTIRKLPVGNNTCPPLEEEEPCEGNLCPSLTSRVCAMSPWTEWTPCSAECGGGTQTRKRNYVISESERNKELNPFNASCPPPMLLQEQPCNTFPCDADCELSDWSPWSACDVPCGMGLSTRTQDVIQEGVGAGIPCPYREGNIQRKPCYAGVCPQNCVVSAWSEWSSCVTESSCGAGVVTRTREVLTYPVPEGEPCPALMETSLCYKPCDRECELGPPTPWTPCHAECQVDGRREQNQLFSYRWRSINVWSRACAEDTQDTQPCPPFSETCQDYQESDCLVSPWEPWSPCSVSCGGGTRSRLRYEVKSAGPNGRPCPALIEREPCGTDPCPVNCETTPWGPWSSCSVECGLGTMTRSKQILRPASTNPPGTCEPLTETHVCVGRLGDCALAELTECKVSEFSSWSECSQPCGHYGVRQRTRYVLAAPRFLRAGGCPELAELEDCNRLACGQNCRLSEWSEWSACTIECGVPTEGMQMRYRQILRHPSPGFPPCPTVLEERRPCLGLKPCPIPCILSDWLEWSPCSAECGIGEKSRIREVIQQPAFGGEHCGLLKDSTECFVKPCVVDCQVSVWEPWTECSQDCGGGTRQRKRDVLNRPLNGGAPCPTLVEYEECNKLSCQESEMNNKADCQVTEWSEWSVCPVECGGGVQQRTREVVHHGRPGGAPCPPLIQRRGCGISRCKDETACVDNIGALEEYHVTCEMLKAQGCDKNIKELAESQGMAYPEHNPPEARVKDACPLTCDVCRECATDCQLRDKGNTVCDAACNNEACEFDLGDCGKDCTLPLPIPQWLRMTPPATGIDVGERIYISCGNTSERFQLAPEFYSVAIGCAEDTRQTVLSGAFPLSIPRGRDGTQDEPRYFLKVDPEEMGSAFVLSRISQRASPLSEKQRSSDGETTMLALLFQCDPDPCPYIHIKGFQRSLAPSNTTTDDVQDDAVLAMNGLYERAISGDGRLHYRQHTQRSGPGKPIHYLWIDNQLPVKRNLQELYGNTNYYTEEVWSSLYGSRPNVRLGFSTPKSSTYSRRHLSPNGTIISSTSFFWRLTPFTPYLESGERSMDTVLSSSDNDSNVGMRTMAYASSTCPLPDPGIYIPFPSCVEPAWTVASVNLSTPEATETKQTIPSVEVSCITKQQRKTLLKQLRQSSQTISQPSSDSPLSELSGAPSSVQDSAAGTRPSSVGGRPVTYNTFRNPDNPEMMFCEDRPEVEAIAAQSCDDLIELMDCSFFLKNTGRKLPPGLPLNITLGDVCPQVCLLCEERCAAGCPEWFLANNYCDPACNVEACNYDKGDCAVSETTTGSQHRTTASDIVPSASSGADSSRTSDQQLSPCIATAGYPLIEYGLQYTCADIFRRMVGSQGLRLEDVCYMDSQNIFTRLQGSATSSPSMLRLLEAATPTLQPLPVAPEVVTTQHVSSTLPRTHGAAGSLSAPWRKNAVRTAVSMTRLCPAECDVNCIKSSDTTFTVPAQQEGNANSKETDHEPLKPSNIDNHNSSNYSPGSEEEAEECVDDPMVERMGFSCILLKAAAEKKLKKGCEVTLNELKTVSVAGSATMNIPEEVSPMTRLMDACPVTCDCCSCIRFHRPRYRSDGLWKIRTNLQENELPNCINDPRIQQMASLSCFEIADALRGHCNLPLKELTQAPLPPGIPDTITLADACGVACGKCPICEDLPLVQDVSGFTCAQIIQAGYDCSKPLEEITSPDSNIRPMAQLQHACPRTCGMCEAPHAYSQALYDTTTHKNTNYNFNPGEGYNQNGLEFPAYQVPYYSNYVGAGRGDMCDDHPHIDFTGVSCQALYQYSNQECQRTLQSMGIDITKLPADLHPLAFISDACPKTCGVCPRSPLGARRCVDHPMVREMNQTCSVLIQVGNRGCNTLLQDLAAGRVPGNIPKQFRIKDVCRLSCGLCVEPSCSDGFHNGKEEGVDCGGQCRACRSCSPAPLKALGPAYAFQGNGIHHGANRTVHCETGYTREAGVEPTTIYCDDGSFNKPTLVCGEPKIEVLRSSVRLFGPDPFDASLLPALYSALEETLLSQASDGDRRQSDKPEFYRPVIDDGMLKEEDQYLRFLTAGDCSELANIGTFVCEDNPLVQRTGFDCSLLARLGCSITFSQLAEEHSAELPADIPKEAKVADACPVTCRTCDVLKKRLHLLKRREKGQVTDDMEQNPSDPLRRNCLRVDVVVHANSSYAAALSQLLQQDVQRSTATHLVTALRRHLQRVESLSAVDTTIPSVLHMSASVAAPDPMHLPKSQWSTLYTIQTDETSNESPIVAGSSSSAVKAARSIFIEPGLPAPVFDSSSVPRGLRPRAILGLMYRPTIGVGEEAVPFPTSIHPPTAEQRKGAVLYFGEKAGVVTGWYDASASASVISSAVVAVADGCQHGTAPFGTIDSQTASTCCSLKQEFERFLAGPCGTQIYGRVVSEADIHQFCFKRTESFPDPDLETLLNTTALPVRLSCYEMALRLVEEYRHNTEITCLIVPYVEQLIHVWCSKDGVADLFAAPESVREASKFCFPSIKTTLQKRFDLLYIASLSDEEMEGICKPHSCTRHHLRYVDSLTQVQLAWSFSGVSSLHTNAPKPAQNVIPRYVEPSASPLLRESRNLAPMGPTGVSEQGSFIRKVPGFQYDFSRFGEIPDRFRHDWQQAQTLYYSLAYNATVPAAHAAVNFGFSNNKTSTPFRRRRMLYTGHPSETFGSFVADFPEMFLDFVCYKVKGLFCQQTLLLLTDENPIHNPTALREPCNTPCFVPMTGILGGLVEAFGKRQNNPYYKALGSILRSYGRFYCTVNNQGHYCGTSLFARMVRSNFVPYSPGAQESVSSPTSEVKVATNTPRHAVSTIEPESTLDESLTAISETCPCSPSFINDGQCDAECFTASCSWDGEDCRVPNMFPEAFYALLNAFADRSAALEYRLSPRSNTSCLLFDPSFVCTGRCRYIYQGGSNLEGCCFTAGLEALSSLLRIEMEHPNVAATGRWIPNRSIALLEHMCQATLDRTCMGGKHRVVLRLDVTFVNIAFYSHETGYRVACDDSEMDAVTEYLRRTITQVLQLVNTDVTRIMFRETSSEVLSEVFIDAGRETPRVNDWLHQEHHRRELTQVLQRRLLTVPLEIRPRMLHGGPLPSVTIERHVDHKPAISESILLTSSMSFETSPRVPYRGTLDFAPDGPALLNESCSTRDLWELGEGYRIYPSNAIDVDHGATRTLRCFKDYYPPPGMPGSDTLVCDNGRWIKKDGLECRRRCFRDDSWKAIRTGGHQVVRREAYNVVDPPDSVTRKTSWVYHATTQWIVCSSGHTASQGRTKTVVSCNDGHWDPVVLACKRQCVSYRPPEPAEGYVILKGDRQEVDHGATLTISCATGFFPMPSLSDTLHMTTRCDDGEWTSLPVACVRPGTVEPRAGPSMVTHLVQQLFTGPGMVGLLIALALCIILIITIATSWKLYFKNVAKQHARDHEHQLGQAAKMASTCCDSIAVPKVTCTQYTTASCPSSCPSATSSLSFPPPLSCSSPSQCSPSVSEFSSDAGRITRSASLPPTTENSGEDPNDPHCITRCDLDPSDIVSENTIDSCEPQAYTPRRFTPEDQSDTSHSTGHREISPVISRTLVDATSALNLEPPCGRTFQMSPRVPTSSQCNVWHGALAEDVNTRVPTLFSSAASPTSDKNRRRGRNMLDSNLDVMRTPTQNNAGMPEIEGRQLCGSRGEGHRPGQRSRVCPSILHSSPAGSSYRNHYSSGREIYGRATLSQSSSASSSNHHSHVRHISRRNRGAP